MSDMRVYLSEDELRQAEKTLPKPGQWDEAIAVTALQVLIHLFEGGSVNGWELAFKRDEAMR